MLDAVLDTPAIFMSFRYLLVGQQKKTRELLRRHLATGPSGRVLDVCCGLGQFANETDGDYLGIDLTSRYVTSATRRWAGDARKSFRVMDALKLELPDKSFDKSLCVAALHHFPDDLAAQVLGEMRRVTRDSVVIVDADGAPRNLLKRALVAADRGGHMRDQERLSALVASCLPVTEVQRYRVGLYDFVMLVCRT